MTFNRGGMAAAYCGVDIRSCKMTRRQIESGNFRSANGHVLDGEHGHIPTFQSHSMSTNFIGMGFVLVETWLIVSVLMNLDTAANTALCIEASSRHSHANRHSIGDLRYNNSKQQKAREQMHFVSTHSKEQTLHDVDIR